MEGEVNSFALAWGLYQKLALGSAKDRRGRAAGGDARNVYPPYLFALLKILDDDGFITTRYGNNALDKATG